MDRNDVAMSGADEFMRSLSARRAWIEIAIRKRAAQDQPVALRKESVDRNQRCDPRKHLQTVALRKESVDRNF